MSERLWPVCLFGPRVPAAIVKTASAEAVLTLAGDVTKLYEVSALAQAVNKYNGAGVFYGPHREPFSRQSIWARDKVGVIKGAFWDGGQREVRGFVELTSEAFHDYLIKLGSERRLGELGLSHDIVGSWVRVPRDGRALEVLTSLTRVDSIEICERSACGSGGRFLVSEDVKSKPKSKGPRGVRRERLNVTAAVSPRKIVRDRLFQDAELSPHTGS